MERVRTLEGVDPLLFVLWFPWNVESTYGFSVRLAYATVGYGCVG